MIEVKSPRWDELTPEEIQALTDCHQLVTELVLRDTIKSEIKENSVRPVFWSMYYEGKLCGTSAVCGRNDYPHLLRHGHISVLPTHRRLRIGSAAYTAHAIAAIMESRRILEDTIIERYSPWMTYSFLPSMKYYRCGIFPARTRGMLDIHFFNKITTQIIDHFRRLPVGTKIMWSDTPRIVEMRERNQKNYSNHTPELADLFDHLRSRIAEGSEKVSDSQYILTVDERYYSEEFLAPGFHELPIPDCSIYHELDVSNCSIENQIVPDEKTFVRRV
jgi:hypothetical protein